MMCRSLLMSAVCAMFLLALAGCQSNPCYHFGVQTRRVSIRTSPAGAEVVQILPGSMGTRRLGVTPIENLSVVVMTSCKGRVNNLNDTLIQFNNVVANLRMPGYHTQQVTLDASKPQSEHFVSLTPRASD